MSLLEIKNLKKGFDGLEVLKNLSYGREGRSSFHHRTVRFRKIHAASVCDRSGNTGFRRDSL